MQSNSSRQTVLATAEQLTFGLEDVLGTIRSLRKQQEFLTLSERQWSEFLEDSVCQWLKRLNDVTLFQPTLWDGH